MFYSETILSRRGPLGKVWLAAHMERKLSKAQTIQTSIEESVDAIIKQEIEVMALRLSGQLLLGVVRIYSRKTKYLLDDCNEALLKIKMAFRPGNVDMTVDQAAPNKNVITLQAERVDLDNFLADLNWDADQPDRPHAPGGQHQANIDDITLRQAEDFIQFNMDDGFDLGSGDGIGSNDFGELDLGLDWGDTNRSGQDATIDLDASMEIEVARDADFDRESIASHLLGNAGQRDADLASRGEPSEYNFAGDVDMDAPDFTDMNLTDLGIPFGDQPMDGGEKTPRASSRASSPLSEPPKTPGPDEDLPTHPAGDVEDPTTPKSKRKPPKEKKQIIDKVIYLKDGPGPKTGANTKERDVSSIVKKQQFLPPSALAMRFLEIRDDPLSHFMPTKTNQDGSFICLAPPGIAPELAELFMRPVSGTKRNRGSSPPKGAKKRKLDAGTAADDDDLPEDIRRAPSHAPSFGGRSDMQGGDQTFDFGDQPMVDDYQMDIPDISLIVGEDGRGASAHPTDRSRMSTPAADGFLDEEPSYADADCPIATFDLPSTQSQSQQEPEPADTDGKGYSKNTAKALSIVRRELQPSADDEEEKVLIFNKMADKASRRAAASFFFELLVLSTKDCIKVSQDKPFGNIEVSAKDKLWERNLHQTSSGSTRLESMAPASRESSVAASIHSVTDL